MDQRPKAKTYNTTLGRKYESKLYDIGLGSDFLGHDTKGTGNNSKKYTN